MRAGRAAAVASLLLGSLCLAACETALPKPDGGASAFDTPSPGERVASEDAVAAFADICLGTAPTFADAGPALIAHGLTRADPNGTIFDATGTLSVRIAAHTARSGVASLRCSVVFQDPDTATAQLLLERRLERFGAGSGFPRTIRFDTGAGRVHFVPQSPTRPATGIFLEVIAAGPTTV